MLTYIIPAIIIIASILAIIVIVVRSFPSLTSINVESIPKEKEKGVRNRIMIERLSRRFVSVTRFVKEVLEPLLKKMTEKTSSLYNRAMELEKETIKKSSPLKQIDLQQQIKETLEDVERLIAEEELLQAEEGCIGVIELDPTNADAYDLLGRVYVLKKDYKKARETLRYLVKLLLKKNAQQDGSELRHQLANTYADLGEVYGLEHKPKQALDNFEKAVDLQPNNPRFLDLLLKISILLKNKKQAHEVFLKLEQADPENKKLPEIKSEINELPDNQAE